MADTLPLNLPPINPPSIASYSFIELLTKQGILEIYPGQVYASSYILTTNSIYSAPNYYITVADDGVIDIDFDITIGKAFDILAGTAYFNVPIDFQSNGAITVSETITFYIRHYDGTTETDLGSYALSYSLLTAVGRISHMLAGKMTMTKKHFKVGDILRVTYSLTATNPAGSTDRLFGIDPANRDATGFDYGTRSSFYIPVKVHA